MNKVKMSDIAKAMNISTVTVSKALADKDGVSEKLRAEIKEKAKELGYVYNRLPLLMREGITYNIGILISERFLGAYSFYWEFYLLQGYPEILSAYGAKEKQTAQQLPPPGNVLETGGIGVHRRKAVANMVARTDSQYAVRDEDAVVQDNIPLDRRKILAFHPEKPTEKRENP